MKREKRYERKLVKEGVHSKRKDLGREVVGRFGTWIFVQRPIVTNSLPSHGEERRDQVKTRGREGT